MRQCKFKVGDYVKLDMVSDFPLGYPRRYHQTGRHKIVAIKFHDSLYYDTSMDTDVDEYMISVEIPEDIDSRGFYNFIESDLLPAKDKEDLIIVDEDI